MTKPKNGGGLSKETEDKVQMLKDLAIVEKTKEASKGHVKKKCKSRPGSNRVPGKRFENTDQQTKIVKNFGENLAK